MRSFAVLVLERLRRETTSSNKTYKGTIMFGSISLTVKRKPKEDWHFNDNGITGVNAAVGCDHGPGMILPGGLSDEQRDLMLWAWEAGRACGFHEGQRKLRSDLKHLLEIYD